MQKRIGSLLVNVFLLTSLLWVVTSQEAHAYLDPGTGSFLLQILLASLFGSLFALKVFWRQVTAQMSRFLSKIKALNNP